MIDRDQHLVSSQANDITSLTIVLVNWNTGDRLTQCLESIATASRDGFALEQVVVVDNASTDESLEGIDSISLPLKVIPNSRNMGFAAACNQGAKPSSSDYILFLNPDTILDHRSLSEPIAFLGQPENSRVGICGVQLRDESGAISRSCARFPTLTNMMTTSLGLYRLAPHIFSSFHMVDWDHRSSKKVDHVIGAFFMVRRSLFQALQGFDRRFFVYLEDIDFSLRAAQRGWQSQYLTDAIAYHEGGGSSKQVKANRLFYIWRSRIQYAWKHLNPLQAATISAVVLTIEPLVRILSAIVQREKANVKNVVVATYLLWASFAGLTRPPEKASSDCVPDCDTSQKGSPG